MKNIKKYKNTLLSLGALSMLIPHSMNAQMPTLDWARQVGGIENDIANSIEVDSDGNVYTMGKFYGTSDFDPGPTTFNLTSNGGADIFILKTDALGNFLWAKNLGGSSEDFPTDLAVDSEGNVFTTGYFRGIADFDPSSAIFNLTSSGFNEDNVITWSYEDIFISKLNESGDFVWAKRIGSPIWLNRSSSIMLDEIGNIYCTGIFQKTVDFNPGPGVFYLSSNGLSSFVLKLDSSGNFSWARSIESTYQSLSTLDEFGNIYLLGNFSGTVDFDPGINTYNVTTPNSDYFVLKLNSDGNFLWVKNMGGEYGGEGKSITIDPFGNVLFTGVFRGSVDFDPSEATFNLKSGINKFSVFISKLTNNGDFVWAKRLRGQKNQTSTGITTDLTGNVYVTGAFSQTVDFDPSITINSITVNGANDVFILKLNIDGEFVWVKNMGGTDTDISGSILVDQNDNIYTVGSFQLTSDFDPTDNILNFNSIGSVDVFIQKLNQNTQQNNMRFFSQVTEDKMDNGKTFNVYPNPAKESFTINTDLENYNIELRDVTGKLVYSQNNINQATLNLDIKHVEAGTYFVTINNAITNEVIKLMVY